MKNIRFSPSLANPNSAFLALKYLFFALLPATLFCSSVLGQNKIYEKHGKVEDISATEITAQTIKGKKPKNPSAAVTVSTSKVLFLFNDVGNFLAIPEHLDLTNTKFQGLMNDYFNSKNPAYIISDRIITIQGVVTTCNFKSENKKAVTYTVDNKDNSIPKNNVALIIYKDGSHKLYKDPKIIYSVLEFVQNNAPIVAKTDASPAAQPVAQPTVVNPPASNTSTAANSKKQADSVPPAASTETAQKSVSAEPSQTQSASPDIDIKEYQDKAIAKVDEFSTYVKIISGKIDDADEVNKYIERAVKLFINEEAVIEVSRLSRSTVNHYIIRNYLERLKELKYTSVDVKSGDYVVVQNLKKNPDGTYSGVISFEQTFIGKKGDNRVYSDKTKKNVNIILKQYSTSVEGKIVTGWDVFLSDIQVVVTKES
jgi:hypothetical protein